MKNLKIINELKPLDLNCSIFSVYDYDGLSMQELLCQFFTKINEIIKSQNEVYELCDWLINIGLKQEVAKKLEEWINDGTLANLINDTLFNELNKKINGIAQVVLTDFEEYAELQGDKKIWTKPMLKAIEKIKNGGKLIIPKGEFLMSAHLDFTEDWQTRTFNYGFTIEGMGTGSIIKTLDNSPYALFIDHPVSERLINAEKVGYLEKDIVIINNLAFDCNNTPNGLKISSSLGITMDNIFLYNLDNENLEINKGGIFIEGAGAFKFDRIYARGSNLSIPININSGSGDGIIINSHITGGSHNILYSNSTGNNKVLNSILQYSKIANIKTMGDTKDNSKMTFKNNLIEVREGDGISCNDGSLKEFNLSFICDNTIWLHGETGANGIILGRTKNNTIKGNKFSYINGAIKGICINVKNGNFNIIKSNFLPYLSNEGIGINIDTENTQVIDNYISEGIGTFINLLNESGNYLKDNKCLGSFTGKGLKLKNNKMWFSNIGNKWGSNTDNSDNSPTLSYGELEFVPKTSQQREIVNSGGDFNRLIKYGVYYIRGVENNKPSDVSNYGLCEVIMHSDYIVQIFYSNDGNIKKRHSLNSGVDWSEWR